MAGAWRTTSGGTRIWPLPDLPRVRVFMHGPGWRKHFEVARRPIAEVAPLAAKCHRPGKQLYWFDLEDDIRELVCECLREDRYLAVYANWSDPREQFRRTRST